MSSSIIRSLSLSLIEADRSIDYFSCLYTFKTQEVGPKIDLGNMVTFSTYSLRDVRVLLDLAIALDKPSFFEVTSVHNSVKENPVCQYEYKGTIWISSVPREL